MYYSSRHDSVGRKASSQPCRTTGSASSLRAGRRLPRVYNFDDNTVYLSPAPHYFSAPTIFCMATQLMGGTAVFMERFDARLALDALRQSRITHSQWVPTMFIRMLKLGDAVRASYSFP